MNRELFELLSEISWSGDNESLLPTQVVMVNNLQFVPPASQGAPNAHGSFHLMLLGKSGLPEKYVRCAPPRNEKFERESKIAQLLCSTADCALFLPKYYTAYSSSIRVLSSDFITGLEHTQILRSTFGAYKSSLIPKIFRARAALVTGAAKIAFFTSGDYRPPCTLSELYASYLGRRFSAGELARVLDILNSTEPLSEEIQHGDFWSRNIFLNRGHCKFIDLDEFGRVVTPLYDFFHFTQSLARLTSRNQDWLGSSSSPHIVQQRRGLISAFNEEVFRLELSQRQVGQCLIYYILDICAHRLRPGIPFTVAEPAVRDAELLFSTVRSGRAPIDLLSFLN